MSAVEHLTPSVLQLTDNAVAKVRDLLDDEQGEEMMLRVFVTGGGCSGFQYGFTFDELLAEDDTPIEKDGVKAVVDALSYSYLLGAEVDYVEGLEGSRFVVNNPNASATCGCGSSFSI